MADRIEVFPKGDSWRWRHKGGKASKPFDTRTAAFEDALLERVDEAIVLLRKDGSVHGELYHESRQGGPPQRVDILAATDRSEAGKLDG